MKHIWMTVSLMFVSTAALAHTGHDVHGFASGVAHPLGGLDHLLAMLAVGMWSAAAMPRQWWAGAAAFMAAMLIGAILGIGGVTLPLLEPSIALSVIIMGLLVIGFARLGTFPALGLIAAFALFHGNAHGVEAPIGGAVALYLLGFLLSTGLLHLAGVGVGALAVRSTRQWVLRLLGAGMSVVGAWLLLAG
jgi:urease accessory protein